MRLRNLSWPAVSHSCSLIWENRKCGGRGEGKKEQECGTQNKNKKIMWNLKKRMQTLWGEMQATKGAGEMVKWKKIQCKIKRRACPRVPCDRSFWIDPFKCVKTASFYPQWKQKNTAGTRSGGPSCPNGISSDTQPNCIPPYEAPQQRYRSRAH